MKLRSSPCLILNIHHVILEMTFLVDLLVLCSWLFRATPNSKRCLSVKMYQHKSPLSDHRSREDGFGAKISPHNRGVAHRTRSETSILAPTCGLNPPLEIPNGHEAGTIVLTLQRSCGVEIHFGLVWLLLILVSSTYTMD